MVRTSLKFLLEKGYEVHGIIRRTSTFNTDRIDHFYVDPHYAEARMFLHYGDLTDGTTMRRLFRGNRTCRGLQSRRSVPCAC